MVSKTEWELRQQRWRAFNEWEAANPPPPHPVEGRIADLGVILQWLPESVRLEMRDPEYKGVQEMRRILALLSRPK